MTELDRKDPWRPIKVRKPGPITKIAPMAQWALYLLTTIVSLGICSYAIYMAQFTLGVTPYPYSSTAPNR